MYQTVPLNLIIYLLRKPIKIINIFWLSLFKENPKFHRFLASLNKVHVTFAILFLIGFCILIISTQSSNPITSAASPINIDGGTKDLFVVKSFIYKDSKVYQGNDAIITLFNGERTDYSEDEFSCRRTLKSEKMEVVAGKVLELIYGPRQCRLTTFRILCPFPSSPEDTVTYEIGSLNNETEEIEYEKLDLSIPEQKPQKFVSCMSRMLAFDDWPLVLMAMETFRFYGGDFAVAYLECAIKEVVDLMKIYESDGILKIRHSYKASGTPNVPYDPDSQTEYANQMTNSHLCLYEFKESADFIAFTDWDDILIGARDALNFGTFADPFYQLSNVQPNAGAFAIQRWPFLAQKTSEDPFAFQAMKYSTKILDPKMVVRPKLVAGVWIHALKIAESPEYYGISVNDTNSSLLLHFKPLEKRKYLAKQDFIDLENENQYFKVVSLQKSMEAMFDKFNFSFNPASYPTGKQFYRSIFNCYIKMEPGVQSDSITFCPTYKACTYPTQNVKVVKVITTHKPSRQTGRFIWHERENVKFEERIDGCL